MIDEDREPLNELLSPLLMKSNWHGNTDNRLFYYCPGCKSMHQIAVETKQENGCMWSWNGDAFFPTFAPSVNATWDYGDRKFICHHVVKEGKIQYLGDCTHQLKDQTIDMIAIPQAHLDQFK